MKKTFVAFGVAVAIICGMAFAIFGDINFGEDPVRDRDTIEANLGEALEAYLDADGYDHEIDNITITDRYYDANYGGEVAEAMITRTDGYCDFAKIRVESVVDWYTQNA